jgi:hypothetical protein
LPSAKIFHNVKAWNINFDKKEKVLDERNFKKKSLTLGVRDVGDDVGRNILIKGDSVQQFASIICRKKRVKFYPKRVKFNPKKGQHFSFDLKIDSY